MATAIVDNGAFEKAKWILRGRAVFQIKHSLTTAMLFAGLIFFVGGFANGQAADPMPPIQDKPAASADKKPPCADPPKLELAFKDDFSEDTRGDYEIEGGVEWEAGKLMHPDFIKGS